MNENKFILLSQKFNRHNIQFEWNEKSQSITIGKVVKVKRKLALGVLLIFLSLLTLFILGLFQLRIFRFFYLIIFSPFVYGIVQIYEYYIYSTKNKYRKYISSNSVTTESPKGNQTYNKDSIISINHEVKKEADLSGIGSVFIKTKDENIQIVTLKHKNYLDLKEDLLFLKEFLAELLNLPQDKEQQTEASA